MANRISPTPRWYGYKEAAEYLGCTVRQCHRWVAQRRMPHTKLGLKVQFTQAQLDDFLAANTFGPEASA
jgi:excisionase family DNA binding protein